MGNIQSETPQEVETTHKGERNNDFNAGNDVSKAKPSSSDTQMQVAASDSMDRQKGENVPSQVSPGINPGPVKTFSSDMALKLPPSKSRRVAKPRRWATNPTKPQAIASNKNAQSTDALATKQEETFLTPSNKGVFDAKTTVSLSADAGHFNQQKEKDAKTPNTSQPLNVHSLQTSRDNSLKQQAIFKEQEKSKEASSANMKQRGQGDLSEKNVGQSLVQQQKPIVTKTVNHEPPVSTSLDTPATQGRSKGSQTTVTQNISGNASSKNSPNKLDSATLPPPKAQATNLGKNNECKSQSPSTATLSKKGKKVQPEKILSVSVTQDTTKQTPLMKNVGQSKTLGAPVGKMLTGQATGGHNICNDAKESKKMLDSKTGCSLQSSRKAHQQKASSPKSESCELMAKQNSEGSLEKHSVVPSSLTMEERKAFIEQGINMIRSLRPPTGPPLSDVQVTIQRANKILSSGISYADALKQCPQQEAHDKLKSAHLQAKVVSVPVAGGQLPKVSQVNKGINQEDVNQSKKKQPFYEQLIASLKGPAQQKKLQPKEINTAPSNVQVQAKPQTHPQASSKVLDNISLLSTSKVLQTPIKTPVSPQPESQHQTKSQCKRTASQVNINTGAKPKFNWVPPQSPPDSLFLFQAPPVNDGNRQQQSKASPGAWAPLEGKPQCVSQQRPPVEDQPMKPCELKTLPQPWSQEQPQMQQNEHQQEQSVKLDAETVSKPPPKQNPINGNSATFAQLKPLPPLKDSLGQVPVLVKQTKAQLEYRGPDCHQQLQFPIQVQYLTQPTNQHPHITVHGQCLGRQLHRQFQATAQGQSLIYSTNQQPQSIICGQISTWHTTEQLQSPNQGHYIAHQRTQPLQAPVQGQSLPWPSNQQLVASIHKQLFTCPPVPIQHLRVPVQGPCVSQQSNQPQPIARGQCLSHQVNYHSAPGQLLNRLPTPQSQVSIQGQCLSLQPTHQPLVSMQGPYVGRQPTQQPQNRAPGQLSPLQSNQKAQVSISEQQLIQEKGSIPSTPPCYAQSELTVQIQVQRVGSKRPHPSAQDQNLHAVQLQSQTIALPQDSGKSELQAIPKVTTHIQAETLATVSPPSQPVNHQTSGSCGEQLPQEKPKSPPRGQVRAQKRNKSQKQIKETVQPSQKKQELPDQNTNSAEPTAQPEKEEKSSRLSGRWPEFQVDNSCSRKCQCKHKNPKIQPPKNVAAWFAASRNILTPPPWVCTAMFAGSLVAGTKFCLDHYEIGSANSH
ncbi:uncharacterized protein LOC106705031 [Latimeria chalumnae]|uniref:uncharacterized protein LOC106705031 n=1 Tax=Latimeria chalumnae TaxID=7897 RepID=UPI0006D8DC3B|nr:PREDICTED: gametogenetin [Latimeria chalumnae]|eukprot:XP_014348907.1 PREDICTED: gametogenetin [Latimeria chalumnae]